MEDLSHFSVCGLTTSEYLKPVRLSYTQNGRSKLWDGISEHDDVQILIFNITRNVFILVKQFRPAVYLCRTEPGYVDGGEKVDTEFFSGQLGVTTELCAGIVDKAVPTVEIAQAEVLEECGYKVPLENLQKITSCRNGMSISGSQVILYYVEVTDAMKVGPGGGLPQEGELIDVVELSVSEARNLIYDESVSREPCLLLGLQWFFHEVFPSCQKVNDCKKT